MANAPRDGVGSRRARDAAAQSLRRRGVVGVVAHSGAHAEFLRVGAQASPALRSAKTAPCALFSVLGMSWVVLLDGLSEREQHEKLT